MSIADRIQAINDHLIDDYKVLRLAGADLTGVNKNIVNLKPTWKERLLYFMNNGTQEVWDSWDKVNGSGTSLSLNNTEEAPMSLTYKGNTTQQTYTGKNLFDPTVATYNCTVNNGVITITSNYNDVYIEGAFSYTEANKFLTLPSGSYYMKSTNSNIRITFYGTGALDTYGTQPRTLNEETKFGGIRVRSIDGTSLQNKSFSLMLATTNDDYEPYVGGMPSPNPSYPQDIQVVSGDNSIEVSKDLMNNAIIHDKAFINANNEIVSNDTWSYTDYIDISNDEYIYTYKSYASGSIPKTIVYNNDKTVKQVINVTQSGTTVVSGAYIRISYPTSYTKPELIQTKSYPISLGVENLLNESVMTSHSNCQVVEGVIKSNSLNAWNNFIVNINNIILEPNVEYYATFKAKAISGSGSINYGGNIYDGTDYTTQNSVSTDKVLSNDYKQFCWKLKTTKENFVGIKMAFQMSNDASNVIMVVKDIIFCKVPNATYTPYGKAIELCKIGNYQDYIYKDNKKWYKYSVIGKSNLKDEAITLQSINSYNIANFLVQPIETGVTDTSKLNNSLCNRFGVQTTSIASTQTEGFLRTLNAGIKALGVYIRIKSERANTVETFRTWLENNPTYYYWVLFTPTTTEITDTTLISQLEEAKKSYSGQTNITQTNNDLSFVLDVVALQGE